MYEISVEREFSAAHAILLNGERESVHGHNWRVQVIVAGPTLDRNDLLCDFHDLERDVEKVIRRFDNNNLNAMSPFDRINPTAERVAQHIGEEVAKKLPQGVQLVRATVSEAAGCKASYLPD